MSECVILPMTPGHWPAVRDIYAEGIATRNATFETELPSWEKWDHAHRSDCRMIAVLPTSDPADVLGWAALSPVSARYVYRGVAEVSVYVAAKARGRGVGKQLLRSLVAQSEQIGIWTLQAGIFPENAASIALHTSEGFREVGRRIRIAKLADVWRDVVLLERRSKRVGL